MPISISAMQGRRKQVTVQYADESVDIWYLPTVVTPRVMRELEADQEAQAVDRIIKQIERFVAEWDVLDANGQRLPVTAAVMEDFPTPFLVAVISAVTEDMYPGKTTGDASATS